MLNKRILVLIFLLVFLPLVGCFPSPAPPITENQAPTVTSIPITAVTVGETYVYNVKATDPDGDTLTYSLTVKPTGMVIDPATGLIKWTPKVKGNYAVVVKVSDGVLDITQSFTIVVSKPSAPPPVNHAPIITSIPNYTNLVGIQYTYTIKATDPDEDKLTYSLKVKPDGMNIIPSTGKITWTPESTGSYDVTVNVSDGKLSTFQSFTITVRDPELELTGIKVEPKEITLFVEGSETIVSVTATYEFRGYGVLVPLGDCTFLSTDNDIVTVGNDGAFTVTAVNVGTATIIVSYGGKTDTIEVTVIDLVHNITQGTYYHTIQAAVNGAIAGDTIEVAAGTYNENININRSLTIVSVDGALTTIIDAQLADMAVLINGADTIAIFEGFTVRNYEVCGIIAGAFDPVYGEDPVEVYILNNIVEEPSTFKDAHNNCIQMGDGTTGTIIGNEVSGAWLIDLDWSGSGILVAGSSGVLVSNNYAHDCELGIAIAGYAKYRDAPAEYNIIEDNLVENCETGISVQMNSIGTIVSDNDAFNNDVGIESAGYISWEPNVPSGTEIHYNNIVGNTEFGVASIVWESPGEAEEVDAINNWWGDATGPTHSTNPDGEGDEVSDNVVYDPWSTEEN